MIRTASARLNISLLRRTAGLAPVRPTSLQWASLSSAPESFSKDDTSAERYEAKFYVPKADRGPRRSAFDMDYMVGETRLARNSRTCPTRDLNFYHPQWRKHKSPYRRFRHMANIFYSAPFQRIAFPELTSVATIAAFVTYYNEYLVAQYSDLATISMSPTAFAGATTAIGLLAGFRLNSSYGRTREGRKAWSIVNTSTRDLARQALMWLKTKDGENESIVANDGTKRLNVAQIRMLRLCQAFPVALIFHSNDKGCHHNLKRKSRPGEPPFEQRVMAEFRAEMKDIYEPNVMSSGNLDAPQLLRKDLERFCSVKEKAGNVPLDILACMAEILSVDDVARDVNPIYLREMDVQVQLLGQALGSSERIVKTPLPTGFTRHSSRLLFMWSNSLPFALYPLLGMVGTLPTSILTAYAVLGVEDISIQLEDPFDILPLREYSDGVFVSVDAIERGYKRK